MSALKTGIISVLALMGPEQRPTMGQLTEVLSDLIRRWLEPENLPSDTAMGKHIVSQWLEKTNRIKNPQAGQ